MDAVMRTLADEHAHAGFFRVDAEALPDLTEKYDVSAVPFFVVLKVREASRGPGVVVVVVRDTHMLRSKLPHQATELSEFHTAFKKT
jgi:hypothetical protein